VLRKAVITVSGLGARLLSVTKERPKEMLLVFVAVTFNEVKVPRDVV
jgi:UTP-glucose-1-phosphate uridylyltransferase